MKKTGGQKSRDRVPLSYTEIQPGTCLTIKYLSVLSLSSKIVEGKVYIRQGLYLIVKNQTG
jgi:hypothetical protein